MGGNAELAMIELVDFNEIYGKGIGETAEPAKKTRRSGGAKKKATTDTDANETTEAAATTEAAPKKKAAKGDDLKLVEGVGPKAAEAFVAAGIVSFADMAATSAEKLKEILDASDGTFNAADTTTWPEQAQMAADGKMDELKAYQDNLKGGREA